MNKEDLIKLAVVAGLEIRVANENLIWIQEDGHDCVPWNPSCDISQAFEVLEGLGSHYAIYKKPKAYRRFRYCVDINDIAMAHDEIRELAICKAVLKAQGEG